MMLSGTDSFVFQCIPMGNGVQIFRNMNVHGECIKFINSGSPVYVMVGPWRVDDAILQKTLNLR